MSIAATAATPAWRTTGQVQSAELTEISGLAASARVDGRLWVHNDSGHAPVLHAVDESGRTTQRVEVAGFAVDWEDLAAFHWNGEPYLAVADTGDNFGWRSETHILLLPEPEPNAAPTKVMPQRVLRLRYPQGPRDVEAMAVDVQAGLILLLEKRKPPAQLFAIDLDGPDEQTARVIGELPATTASLSNWGARDTPTAMELDARRRHLWVMTYRQVLRFSQREGESWAQSLARGPDRAVPLPRGGRLYEALAVDAEGRVWATSEGRTPALLLLQQ
jgi:hypothetical protein